MMSANDVGIIYPTKQQTASAGTFSDAQFFQPLNLAAPQLDDVGIILDGKFFPVTTADPSEKDIVALVDVPVGEVSKKNYCLQVDDTYILPQMNEILYGNTCKIWSSDGSSYVTVYNSSTPVVIISDTPTEDDPNFDPSDKNAPGYIKNEGISFYSPTHEEYDLNSFEYNGSGLGYIYCFNEDMFPTDAEIARHQTAMEDYEAAKQATIDAEEVYRSASYILRLPGVLAERDAAYQAAYDASISAAYAPVEAAQQAYQDVCSQRDAACNAAYQQAAAEYADEVAAAQAEETAASAAYYQAESDANAAAQAAYDAVITNNGTEDEAWAAYNTEYASHTAGINAANDLWMQKSESLWSIQEQQSNSGNTAYSTEYENWQVQVDAAYQAFSDASAAYNVSGAEAAALAAAEEAAAAFKDAIEAAHHHDEVIVPQYKMADWHTYLDAMRAERIAGSKVNGTDVSFYSAPYPTLRSMCGIASPDPLFSAPSTPFAQKGTIWNGKPFTPPERLLYQETYSPGPFLCMRYRAFRLGRTLGKISGCQILRLPGKIIVEYNKSTRLLTVTTPYSNWVKISAVYASSGGHLFTEADSPASAEVNANDSIVISFKAEDRCSCSSYANYFVQKYVNPITVTINVLGDDLTESFTKTVWNKMPERGAPIRKVAVKIGNAFDYYITPNGTGDGLSPDNPGSWDSILTPHFIEVGGSGDNSEFISKRVAVSGTPTTSGEILKTPRVEIVGGWNSDFTAIVDKPHIAKAVRGAKSIENFTITDPKLFHSDGYNEKIMWVGVFTNCNIHFSGEDNSESPYYYYFWNSLDATFKKCSITTNCLIRWEGTFEGCTISGKFFYMNGRFTDCNISISGTRQFRLNAEIMLYGIFHNFVGDAYMGPYYRNSLWYPFGLFDLAHDEYTNEAYLDSLRVYGPSGYILEATSNTLLRTTLNVSLPNGRAKENGYVGDSITCVIGGNAVESQIHIKAGKPGTGGDAFTRYIGGELEPFAEQKGGDFAIGLPPFVRDTVITLSGLSVEEPLPTTGGDPGNRGSIDIGNSSYAGIQGFYIIVPPYYYVRSSFPQGVFDEYLQPHREAIHAYLSSMDWIEYSGGTVCPVYWGVDGETGIGTGVRYITAQRNTRIRNKYGTDGGMGGNGCLALGIPAGEGGETSAMGCKKGMNGITIGEFFE